MNIRVPAPSPHCDRPDSKPPRTALLIDDEAYFRRFVSEVVSRAWHGNIVLARDGAEGIRLFPLHAPQFVILDISMPNLDGVKTLAALRQMSRTVPIIMLTSISEEKVVEECVGYGATFFICKHLPAHELTRALTEALHEFVENNPERSS